jgi:hypothetical protein
MPTVINKEKWPPADKWQMTVLLPDGTMHINASREYPSKADIADVLLAHAPRLGEFHMMDLNESEEQGRFDGLDNVPLSWGGRPARVWVIRRGLSGHPIELLPRNELAEEIQGTNKRAMHGPVLVLTVA